MTVFSRILVTVAAAVAAAGAAVEHSALESVETAQLRDAVSSDAACGAEEGGPGVELLQHKASAAVAAGVSAEKPSTAASERRPFGSPASAVLFQAANEKKKTDAAAPFNCTAKPQYCGDPLHCENMPTIREEISWAFDVAEGGHTNLKIWCTQPNSFSEGIVKECLKNHNPTKAAWITYHEQEKSGALDADGSYCFLVGHCDNDKVTDATTIADAEAMCDAKYGPDAWRKLGIQNSHLLKFALEGAADAKTGFHDREIAHWFAKLACAMGNYHCDVIYCRETYCKLPEYINKYGHWRYEDPKPLNPFFGR